MKRAVSGDYIIQFNFHSAVASFKVPTCETRPGQCETLREGERTSSDNGAEFTTEAVKTEGEAGCKERRDSTDFGSCYVAFTINNRLLVLAVSHR